MTDERQDSLLELLNTLTAIHRNCLEAIQAATQGDGRKVSLNVDVLTNEAIDAKALVDWLYDDTGRRMKPNWRPRGKVWNPYAGLPEVDIRLAELRLGADDAEMDV